MQSLTTALGHGKALTMVTTVTIFANKREDNMTIIKPIYDNGSNGLVKIMRESHKNGKKLSDLSADEMARLTAHSSH